MEKKSNNTSKLQRIVSSRNDPDDETASGSSSKMTSSSASSQFSSQHEILKYSSNNSKLIKRHLTSSLNNVNLADSDAKVFYPNVLTRKVSSNKDESIEFTNANSTNAILQPNSSKTFADQQHVKPLRKIAVVNSSSNGSITANNLNAYKSHRYGEETATSYQQHFQQHQQLGSLLKSSSSSNHLGHLKSTIDIENTSTVPSSISTRIPNTNILTASSWRVGEAIVQKQLKHHLKQQQQLKQHAAAAATSSSSGAAASASTVTSLILPSGTVGDVAPIDLVTNRRHLLLAASSCQQSGNNKPSKRTEFLSVPIQQPPKSSVAKASSNNQPTTSVNVSKTVSKNALLSSLTDSANSKTQAKSSSLTKRIYETKSDREKLKRDEEERKRKLQEIYRKQRSTQTSELMRCKELPKLTSTSVSFSSSSSANNLISASTSLTDHSKQQQQLISNKYLYEQDMSKILQDKITHLLNDNDKLVEKQRQQFINYNKRSKQHQQVPITSTANQFVSNELLDGISQPNEDDDDYSNEETNEETDEIETTNALRNLTNFETENKKINEQPHQSQHQPPYVHKNDRIKKICSIALDLQTKMQQTKLKLFGMNPNDESILYYGNNVNNMTEDDYDDENQLIPSKSFQIQTQTIKSKPTSTNCVSSSTTVLTPNMAARRIQIAYRKYLNRRRRYLKKNQQHHINIIKYNNMNNSDELKLKSQQQQQLVKNPKLEQQLHHLHNQYNYHLVNDNENLSDDYLRKKTANTKYSRVANQISLIKTMEQNDLIYESDYTRDDLIRNNSKKLVLNKYEINKSLLSNQSSNSSSTETVASSNSLSKYMLSLAQQQQQQQQQQNSILLPTKKSSRSTNVSSSSSSNRVSKLKSSSQNQTNTNEDESISSNSEESISTSTSSSSTNHSSSNNTTNNTLTNGSLTSVKSNKSKNYEKKSCLSPSSSSSSSTITQATTVSQRSNSSAKPQLKLQNKLRSLSYTNREESIKESRYSAVPLESSNYLEGVNGSNSHAEEVKVVFKEPARISSSLYDPTDYELLNKVNKLQLPKRSLSANASSLSTLSYLDEPESEGILNVNKRLSVNHNFNTINKRHRESCNNIDSISDLMGSVQIGDTTSRRSTFGMGYEDDDELEKSFRALLPSESHLKKSKHLDANKEHSFIYSINDMSQTSLLSQFDNQTSIRISFEDDSFKKFTGEIVKKYMQEEEMRSKHQANLLKLREKALIDKTNAELTWLEQMKKKVQDKGEDEKMPSILKKEKGIMQKLKEEQENINQMKEVQRKATESRLKILSQHSEVIKWCQNKLKKQHNFSSSLIDPSDVNVSKLTCVNDNDFLDNDLLLHDQPNPLDDSSNINQSLIESKVMKQVKQHLNSEKYLTEREKKLRLRRKHAEEIIAWKKKLDDEELQVREIEKKANLALISKNEITNNSILNETASSQTHEKFKQNVISKTTLDDESHTISSQKTDISSVDLTLAPMNNLIASDKKNDKLKTSEPSTSILNLKKKTIKSRKEQQDETTTNKSENTIQTEKETSLKIKETIGPSVLDAKQPITLDHKVKELSQTIKSSDKSKTKQSEEIHRKIISSNECLNGKMDQLEATKIVDNYEQVNSEYQLAEKSLNNSLVKLSTKSVDISEKPTSEEEFSNKIIVESIVDELVLNEAEELLQVNLQISKKDGSFTETKQNECEQNIQQYEEDSLSNRSIKLQETTDKLIELKIPYSKKIIEYLSDLAIKDYFWKRIENNLDLKSIQQDLINDENELVFDENLSEYFKTNLEESSDSQESDEIKSTNKDIEIIFKKMLLDLIAELIHDLYLERYENEISIFKYMPGTKKSFKKQYFKSFVRGPKQIKEAQLIIKNKLNGLLKLTETSSNCLKSSTQLKSKWHSHKRLDLVDSILDHEMREQEYEWSNYEQDEYEAKILISNTIFDMILKDTIDCFQFNIMNKIY